MYRGWYGFGNKFVACSGGGTGRPNNWFGIRVMWKSANGGGTSQLITGFNMFTDLDINVKHDSVPDVMAVVFLEETVNIRKIDDGNCEIII